MFLENEINIFARTIFGEARGEFNKVDGGLASLIGVANVIMNRVKKQKWFGKNLIDVCKKPKQFSCWNIDDVNYKIINSISDEDRIFSICKTVAFNVANDYWPDLTKGSDHYHSSTLPFVPIWAKNKKPLVKIGNHLFFNLEV